MEEEGRDVVWSSGPAKEDGRHRDDEMRDGDERRTSGQERLPRRDETGGPSGADDGG